LAKLLYKIGLSKLASFSAVTVKSKLSCISFSVTKLLLANWGKPLKCNLVSPSLGLFMY